jgi:hypothetical protein
MKKTVSILLIVLLILVISNLILFAEEAKYDFRKTNWGMSKEQVKEIESLEEILSTLPFFITAKEYDPDRIYTIQVGAFSKEGDAQNLAKEINDRGYQTYVIKGTNLYKVQVGEFKSYKEAQSFSDKLGKMAVPLRNNLLIYQDYIGGFDCRINYNFLEDKLFQSFYLFNEKHTNKNLYIDDYEELKEILTKNYGKPKIDKVTWKNDLYKSDKQNWGTAISMGHLIYETSWETSTTKINLKLSGDNLEIIGYVIYLTLVYDSKELKEWADKILEEKRNKILEEKAKDF